MSDLTSLVTAQALTTSGNSSSVITPDCATLGVVINVTAVSGTTPSATFKLQWSNDGQNWADADGATDTFAAITAVGGAAKAVAVKGEHVRAVWTISGTTPSLTTTITFCEVRASRR